MLTLTHNEAEDLKVVVRHLYDDEEKHYQSCDPQQREGHIFSSVHRLAERLRDGGPDFGPGPDHGVAPTDAH